MVKNTKLLISTALISSFFLGNIANATHEDSDIVGGHIAVSQAPLDASQDWTEYTGRSLPTEADVDAYDQTVIAQRTAWDRAGEGTLYPEAPGAYIQKAGRAAWATTKFALAVAYPILETAAVRAGMNVVIGKAIPFLAEKGAETVAAATHLPGAARSAVKAIVQGEIIGDGVYLARKVEPYILPVAKAGYMIGKGVIKLSYAAGKAALSGVSKAYSWFSSSKPTANAAEAA